MKKQGDFYDEVIAEFGTVKPFEPCAYYDADGDCIEFLFSNEQFKAERLDNWVTVYYAENTGEIIGGLVKDIRKLLDPYPGFKIDIIDGSVRVSLVLRARYWAASDTVNERTYRNVIALAEEKAVKAEYAEAGCG